VPTTIVPPSVVERLSRLARLAHNRIGAFAKILAGRGPSRPVGGVHARRCAHPEPVAVVETVVSDPGRADCDRRGATLLTDWTRNERALRLSVLKFVTKRATGSARRAEWVERTCSPALKGERIVCAAAMWAEKLVWPEGPVLAQPTCRGKRGAAGRTILGDRRQGLGPGFRTLHNKRKRTLSGAGVPRRP